MTKCDAQMVKYILQLGLSLLRKTLLSLAGVFILINLTAVLNLNVCQCDNVCGSFCFTCKGRGKLNQVLTFITSMQI